MKKIRQDIVENQKTAVEEYASLTNSQKQQLRWFQDQKIGVIFHWGLYSAAGIVESWQLSKEDTWARKKPWRKDLTTLRHDYWNLAKAFNPAKFDPEKWATEIQKAGFRYAIFTTKHHDGFNMYATQQSDFNVTHYTGKDLFHEFAKSLTAHNVAVGAYYSKADWHCLIIGHLDPTLADVMPHMIPFLIRNCGRNLTTLLKNNYWKSPEITAKLIFSG
ncbi:alpha-L-fucosidase [Pediococcus acidilactici NGRI 0510Q]|nr:alpha-L-fucosidase [Pediococcus acidilactici NGRI 0510Q]